MDTALTAIEPGNPSNQQVAPAYTRSHHYPELDALRGLAAFAVVLSHFRFLWDRSDFSPTARVLVNEVFLVFSNGRCSVILFFLLSGFVLTLPYKRGNELPYGTFVLRRLARIYVPYLAALVLSIVADWRFHQSLQVSVWFSKTWTAPLTRPLILQHILLVGNYDVAQINTAFWSLAVEIRLSLLFPLLCIPLLRWNRHFAIAFFGALILLDIISVRSLPLHLDSLSAGNAKDMTLGLVSFAAGILLARWLEPAKAFWGRSSHTQHVVFGLVSIGLLGWLDPFSQTRFYFLLNVLTIVGGCGVLIVALSSHRIRRVLNHRLPAWLGRISYSLYLVHATLLFMLVHLLLGRFTRLEILVPYLVGAMGAAVLFYFVVEKPSIRLSRRIGRAGRMLSNRPAEAK